MLAMKHHFLIPIVIILAAVAGLVFWNTRSTEEEPSANVTETNIQNQEPTQQQEPDQDPKPEHSIDDPLSIWVVVNRERPLDRNFEPTDLVNPAVPVNTAKTKEELSMRKVPAKALEDMFAAAKVVGYDLLLGSGFRDYDLQSFYYNNYVSVYGQAEADKWSAKPGTSEHQTGLVADVAPSTMNCYLETCFGSTPEGKWVAVNAHKYGFIIRYQEGKSDITGYQYEPWHIRYVGVELATELFNNGKTLEEHFNLLESQP